MNAERPLDRVLERLEGVRERNGGYVALCPSHDDTKPSLSVHEADDGRALLHCFAGCPTEDVCEALDLELSDLFADCKVPVSKSSKALEFYIYRDVTGEPAYKIKRTPDKQFYPYMYYAEKSGYSRKAGWFGRERLPYNLDRITSDNTSPVYWFEGEKDADRAGAMGLLATTSPGGTKAYREELVRYFEDRDVVLVPDNDEPGREYAQTVAKSLQGVAKSVKVLHLPGLPQRGDFSDFVDLGGTKEAFLEYARRAPEFQPEKPSEDESFTEDDEGSGDDETSPLELLSLGTDIEIPEQEYLIEGLLPKGHPAMVYGDGGVGKSALCLSMACALAEGLPDWLGFALEQTNVVYLDYEMPFEEQVRRARKIARGLGLESVPETLYYLMGSPEYSWDQVKDACIKSGVGLLIVDSFGPALAGDMEASNDIIAFIRDFVKPLLNHGITVLFIDHQPKAQGSNYQDMTAFGSVYKRNLVRSQIQVEGFQREEELNTYQIVFRHKKHNFGPKLPPFGAELVFDDDRIRLRSVVIDPETMMKEKDIKVEDRVLLALYEEGGALTKADIAERIGSNAGSVANAMTTLRKRELATESDQKEGRQSMYGIMQKGITRVELELTGIPSPNGWQDGGKGFVE